MHHLRALGIASIMVLGFIPWVEAGFRLVPANRPIGVDCTKPFTPPFQYKMLSGADHHTFRVGTTDGSIIAWNEQNAGIGFYNSSTQKTEYLPNFPFYPGTTNLAYSFFPIPATNGNPNQLAFVYKGGGSKSYVYNLDTKTQIEKMVTSDASAISVHPALAGNGRRAFESDINVWPYYLIYTEDPVSRQQILVSQKNGAKKEGNVPRISFDGKYIFYIGHAAPGVDGPADSGVYVIYRYEMATGLTQLVTPAIGGALPVGVPLPNANIADDTEGHYNVSADGNLMVFRSAATNLVMGVNTPYRQVYLRDIRAGTTTLISATATGLPGDGNSGDPVISHNGRFIAFISSAPNLRQIPNSMGWDDGSGIVENHIFLYDRQLQKMYEPRQPLMFDQNYAAISDTALYVVSRVVKTDASGGIVYSGSYPSAVYQVTGYSNYMCSIKPTARPEPALLPTDTIVDAPAQSPVQDLAPSVQ